MALAGLGFAISGVCNLLNGKLQRDFQREQNEISRELNRQEREADRRDKRELDQQHTQRDDARYNEKTSWPLEEKATTIIQDYMANRAKGSHQVLVITADSESEKVFDEVAKGAWRNINEFLGKNFPTNSCTSVDFKIGQFTRRVKGQDIDVQSIYNRIPQVPTILIATQVFPNDDKFGFLVAAWGEGISVRPVRNIINFDFKHLYVESIRRDTSRFVVPKSTHKLKERREIKANRDIFEQEKAFIDENIAEGVGGEGTDWISKIDEQYTLYDDLSATSSAKSAIQSEIEQLFEVFFTVIADSYFVCTCGSQPRLPFILDEGDLKVKSSWDRDLIGYYVSLVIASCKAGRCRLDNVSLENLNSQLAQFGLHDERHCLQKLDGRIIKKTCNQVGNNQSMLALQADSERIFSMALECLQRKDFDRYMQLVKKAAQMGHKDAQLVVDEEARARMKFLR